MIRNAKKFRQSAGVLIFEKMFINFEPCASNILTELPNSTRFTIENRERSVDFMKSR